MFDSRQLNCMIRDRTATITPTSRPCQGFLVALYRTYRYAYLWWPGVEVADETMAASRNVSALLNFAPHPIGSPVKGSRQFCCRGVELIHINPINYQLLALRCGHRSPVGNGFIRSVCHGFVGTSQSGNRKNCIGTSVKALLKKCRRHTAIIHYSLFIIHHSLGRSQTVPFAFPCVA